MKMIKIEHWSDYRCPFCYIADAEFEDMMKTLGDTSDIVLINKAFELDPEGSQKGGLFYCRRILKKIWHGMMPQ